LEQALVPATRAPADVLGLRKGRLAPGYDSDIVLLDRDYRSVFTMVKGEVVYHA
jgi:N-acetylglucosamine-6-phosphate deacetylase